jgi:hypothetical protein
MNFTSVVILFFLCILLCHGLVANVGVKPNHGHSKFSKEYRRQTPGYNQKSRYSRIRTPNINQRRINFRREMKNN